MSSLVRINTSNAAIRIVLPAPPSLNNSYASRMDGRGRYATPKLKQWKSDAGWMLKSTDKNRIVGKYRIAISFADTMKGDIDNRIKACLDLLVENRVTPDDRFAWEIICRRSIDVKAGECIVEVSAL